MHEQICEILGLAPTAWPPDHYALLGLKRRERDVQLIEQRVHDRMRQVRPYQLSYPEQVTEVMNRLAQAFACLTDPTARQAYDESLQAPHSQANFASRTENGSIDPEDPGLAVWSLGTLGRSGIIGGVLCIPAALSGLGGFSPASPAEETRPGI